MEKIVYRSFKKRVHIYDVLLNEQKMIITRVSWHHSLYPSLTSICKSIYFPEHAQNEIFRIALLVKWFISYFLSIAYYNNDNNFEVQHYSL